MKERIIGAAVLVVFVVLVVPIFLDGPPGEGEVVTERVLLPGQDDAKTQTIVLDRDRTEPVPAGTSNDAPAQAAVVTPADTAAEAVEDRVASQPEPQAPEPVAAQPEPARESAGAQPKAAAQETSASPTGMWAVQLGSFSNKESAEKLAADLRKQGYAAFLSQFESGNATLHRVRIGPQRDRASAEAMAARLARVDIKGQVVPHP